jgi:hypothetical protein
MLGAKELPFSPMRAAALEMRVVKFKDRQISYAPAFGRTHQFGYACVH